MSFREIEKRPGRGGEPATYCRLRSVPPNRTAIVIAANVTAELGWAKGDRVIVEAGQVEDAGTLRVRKNALGRKLGGNDKEHALMIMVPTDQLGLPAKFPPTRVDHEIGGDALIITLPVVPGTV